MRMDELVLYEKDLLAREFQLETIFAKWTPRGGELSFKWYQRYVDSGYVTLPYPGGWANQPVWWQDDVEMFDMQNELHWIPTELRRIKDAIKGLTKSG